MGNRTVLVVVAVIAGALAVVATYLYLSALRRSVEKEEALVKVYVAAEDLERNASAEDLVADNRVEVKEVPRKFVPAGAVTDPAEVSGKVLVASVPKGAILTKAYFASVEAAGMPVQLPPGYRAIAIAVNEVVAVGNKIVSGDRVDIVVSFDSGSGGTALTKTVLQNVLVLEGFEAQAAVGQRGGALGGAQQQREGRQTILLALSPQDVEKLVYAEHYGKVWLTLRPAKDEKAVPTPGQTLEMVVK